MQSLHIFSDMPTPVAAKDAAKSITTFDCLEQHYEKLKTYLTELSIGRDSATFEEHERVIAKLTHELGCSALSIGLSHYDVDADVIRVGEQTYRKHIASSKTYQSVLGSL